MKTVRTLVHSTKPIRRKIAHALNMNAKLWLQSRMMPDEIYDTDADFKKIVDGVEGLVRREVYHTSAVHMAEMLGLDKAEEVSDFKLIDGEIHDRS